MDTKSYPSTDLANNTGDVLRSANNGPVEITQYRKTRYVLMTIEDYAELNTQASTQQAYYSNEIPADLDAVIDAEMNSILAD